MARTVAKKKAKRKRVKKVAAKNGRRAFHIDLGWEPRQSLDFGRYGSPANPSFAGYVRGLFASSGFRTERIDSIRGTGPQTFLAIRRDLRERRYMIDVKNDLSPREASALYHRFRNFGIHRTTKFDEFDEYWIVTEKPTDHLPPDMLARERNGRHFSIVSRENLERMLEPLRPPAPEPPPPPKKATKAAPEDKARTKVGKAILRNEKDILIALAALELLIDEKLNALKDHFPNSDEAIAQKNAELSDYEKLRARVDEVKGALQKFLAGDSSETKTAKSVKTFTEGVQEFWTTSHQYVCQSTYNMGLFATAVGVCSLAGAGGKMAVGVSAAMVGGKSVVDAIKGLGKKFF